MSFAAGASSTRCATFARNSTGQRRALQERAAAVATHRSGCGRARTRRRLLAAQFLARGGTVDAAALAAAQQAVRPEDICYILYTSGSTSAPKGVTLAHGPLIANGFDIGQRQHLRVSDRLWLAVPLFWSFGSANPVPAIILMAAVLCCKRASRRENGGDGVSGLIRLGIFPLIAGYTWCAMVEQSDPEKGDCSVLP